MLPVMMGMMAASAITKGIESFEKISEFKKQIRAQNAIYRLDAQAVVAQREATYNDLDRRALLTKGTVLARAGKSGVSTESGSITEALADIAAVTATDKYRTELTAQFALATNEIKIMEGERQMKAADKFGLLDAISGGFNFGGNALGATQ